MYNDGKYAKDGKDEKDGNDGKDGKRWKIMENKLRSPHTQPPTYELCF